jgi:hypothetical protein
MPLTQQGVEDLQEFARARAAAAQEAAPPARLELSTRSAPAGDPVLVRWAVAAGVLPVGLRLGDDAPWQLVAQEGELATAMPAHNLVVTLRVGRRQVRRAMVTPRLVTLDFVFLPERQLRVRFGADAQWAYAARGAVGVAWRELGAQWQQAPLEGRIILPRVAGERRAEAMAIGRQDERVTTMLTAVAGEIEAPTWDSLVAKIRHGDPLRFGRRLSV